MGYSWFPPYPFLSVRSGGLGIPVITLESHTFRGFLEFTPLPYCFVPPYPKLQVKEIPGPGEPSPPIPFTPLTHFIATLQY